MEPAIRTECLVKTYRGRAALDGVSLSVARSSVFGLLGPNGAGKTTFVRLLSTLIRPDSGAAWVLGHDVLREPEAVRARISLTGQFASVDEDLTGRENLVLVGRLLGLARAAARGRGRTTSSPPSILPRRARPRCAPIRAACDGGSTSRRR
jgi:ABC-type multidrug transport system ATPase subunit